MKIGLIKNASRRAGWTHPNNALKQDTRWFKALISKCGSSVRLRLYIALSSVTLVNKGTNT